MAIVKYGNTNGGDNLDRRGGIKAAKKAAKHPAKKHAAKHLAKHPGKKAAKHAPDPLLHGIEPHDAPGKAGDDLAKAFHHLRRAGAVISLLDQENGADLRALLDRGVQQYRLASVPKAKKHLAKAAQGLLRATEHLALGALYSARATFLVEVAVPEAGSQAKELKKLRNRLDEAEAHHEGPATSVGAMARELLRHAEVSRDMHLQHELTKAVDGLTSALEAGL